MLPKYCPSARTYFREITRVLSATNLNRLWGNIAKLNFLTANMLYLAENIYIMFIENKKKPVRIPNKIKKNDFTGFSM
jgi:hypothetical protein